MALPVVEVNSLVSYDTELPYEYYSLPFCKPAGGVQKSTSSVNPGTILSGLRMYNSPYEFQINVRALSLPLQLCAMMLAMSVSYTVVLRRQRAAGNKVCSV